MSVIEKQNEINTKYDNLKTEIEAKEITQDYTKEMKEQELMENETLRSNELKAAEEEYQDMLNNLKNNKATINYEYINPILENLDFTAPEPITVDNDNLQSVMNQVPGTIENTKYIYLTLDNKYIALNELSDSEYDKYMASYNMICESFNNNIVGINKTYYDLKTEIEAKEITEIYTEEMKNQELLDNETAKQQALTSNETNKKNSIKPLNEEYLNTMTKIGVAMTQLKTDKETGFSGDVHINGKLHVDEDINLEGKINNISVDEFLTQSDLTNKADTNHLHTLSDITDYTAPTPYNDSELRTLINSSVSDINTTLTQKADLEHNHFIDEIIDYEPYNDSALKKALSDSETELRALIDQMEKKGPQTFIRRYNRLQSTNSL